MDTQLIITCNEIRVTTAGISGGPAVVAQHYAEAVMPGHRRPVPVTVSPWEGVLNVAGLSSGNGSVRVSPADWENVVRAARVVSADHPPIEITPHLRDRGTAQALAVCYSKELKNGAAYAAAGNKPPPACIPVVVNLTPVQGTLF